MRCERIWQAEESPLSGRDLYVQGDAVLLVPRLLGESVVPRAWHSADGKTFTPSAVDLSLFGGRPDVALPALHVGCPPMLSGDGRLFYRNAFNTPGPLVEAPFGPTVRFAHSAVRYPEVGRFVVKHVTADAARTLFAAGHWSRDSGIGALFRSRDGVAWEPIAPKLPGSVERLQWIDGELYALSFQSLCRVHADGADVVAKFKDVLVAADVREAGVTAFADTFAASLPAGAKRAKYVPLPSAGRVRVARTTNGFVIGRQGGVWTTPDGLTLTPVDGWNESLLAGRPRRDPVQVVAWRDGALVLTDDGGLYFARVP